MTGKNENRGGRRPGAGRKKVTLSQSQINKMIKAAKKRAKETGRTLDDILLDFAYGLVDEKEVDNKDRLAAIKLYKDFTISKHSEKDVNITDNRGPKIGLPARKPDPAKLVGIDGGKK